MICPGQCTNCGAALGADGEEQVAIARNSREAGNIAWARENGLFGEPE